MTWRLRTCFRMLAVVLCAMNCIQAQVSLSGTVSLTDSHAFQRKPDYSNVAIWLDPVNRSWIPPSTDRHAVMLQKDKRFTPHLLIVEAGTRIDFPNQDPIFHNAFSNFDGQIFDIGLYPPGKSRTVKFDRPGIVRVFCNIHSTMSAIIVVVDTEYFATTLENGSFAIHNVAPGEYVVHFFDERALPETLERLKCHLSVAADPINLGRVLISEAGYLPSTHKNKYGLDYPAAPNTSSPYPSGGR